MDGLSWVVTVRNISFWETHLGGARRERDGCARLMRGKILVGSGAGDIYRTRYLSIFNNISNIFFIFRSLLNL